MNKQELVEMIDERFEELEELYFENYTTWDGTTFYNFAENVILDELKSEEV